MKMEGLDYEERMAELEKLEHPKPNRDFIYSTFNAFADKHPWVGQENIRPKSIAREMFENFRSFADYIRDYESQRSEGLLLRHLNGVYKVLGQTVPDGAKTDAVREMELYLGTLIRQVDSSLLDEWEKMRDPNYEARIAAGRSAIAGVDLRPPGAEEAAQDITRDTKAFIAAIRNRIFTFLRAWVVEDFEAALAVPDVAQVSKPAVSPTSQSAEPDHPRAAPPSETPAGLETRDTADLEVCATGQPWTAERLGELMEDYLAEHERLCLDPEARNIRHTYVTPSDDNKTWRVQQMLVDPEGHNDWVAEFEVDLTKSRAAGKPVLRLHRIGPLV
jgi:hypothetical protein